MLRNYFRFVAYLILVIGFSNASAGAHDDFFKSIPSDDASTVMTLMVRGFDPNALDDKGQNALYLSQRHSAFKVAEALMSHPQLRIDQANAAGETPLMMAALRGQVPWMVRLLDKGARIEGAVAGAGGDARGWTPLHYAASAPDAKAVEVLLARGARTDARSPNGTTPLMMAAQYGSEAAVDLLLKQGADARLRNDLGLNVVDFARRAARESLAARLAAAAR